MLECPTVAFTVLNAARPRVEWLVWRYNTLIKKYACPAGRKWRRHNQVMSQEMSISLSLHGRQNVHGV